MPFRSSVPMSESENARGRSALARECGGEIVMPCSSASGLLQRKNGVHRAARPPAVERACARTRRGNRYAVFVRKRTPTARTRRAPSRPAARGRSALARECGVQIVMPCSSASGLLQRENGVHRAARPPAVGARLRANAECKSLCRVRPQAMGWSAPLLPFDSASKWARMGKHVSSTKRRRTNARAYRNRTGYG